MKSFFFAALIFSSFTALANTPESIYCRQDDTTLTFDVVGGEIVNVLAQIWDEQNPKTIADGKPVLVPKGSSSVVTVTGPNNVFEITLPNDFTSNYEELDVQVLRKTHGDVILTQYTCSSNLFLPGVGVGYY